MLKNHFQKAAKNATDISSISQNNIITVFEKVIVTQMQNTEVFQSPGTDSSKQEQLVVCLRYLNQDILCERFLTFAIALDLTGGG